MAENDGGACGERIGDLPRFRGAQGVREEPQARQMRRPEKMRGGAAQVPCRTILHALTRFP